MRSTRTFPSERRSTRSSTTMPRTGIRRSANGLRSIRVGPSTSRQPRPHGLMPSKASSPSSPTGASNVARSDPSPNFRSPSTASSQRPTPIPNPSCGSHLQAASSPLSNVGSKRLSHSSHSSQFGCSSAVRVTGNPSRQTRDDAYPHSHGGNRRRCRHGTYCQPCSSGGNVTGTTVLNPELMAKRLELLKEIAPAMTRAAVLLNPDNAANGPVRQAMEMTAKALRVGLQPFELRGSGELERVFAVMADRKIDALVVHDDQVLIGNAKAIATFTEKQKLPSCGFVEYAAAGGLSAY